MNDEIDLELFDPDLEADPDLEIREYDIVASPNGFNVLSYFTFFASGAIKIPGFQRHYVWDIRKASRLIESILLGLPVPQVFLYEKARNEFLVIDGQQRLLTIYYFMKGRFPKRVFVGTSRGICRDARSPSLCATSGPRADGSMDRRGGDRALAAAVPDGDGARGRRRR